MCRYVSVQADLEIGIRVAKDKANGRISRIAVYDSEQD